MNPKITWLATSQAMLYIRLIVSLSTVGKYSSYASQSRVFCSKESDTNSISINFLHDTVGSWVKRKGMQCLWKSYMKSIIKK